MYDRYATVGRSNHNSSKFADDGGLSLISSRDVAGPAAVVSATEDERGQQVVLEQRVAGADWLRVTYRLPADLPHLEIVDRLRKPRTWDKESAYLAFPFAAADPVVLTESAGGLTGPGLPQVPGGAEYMRASGTSSRSPTASTRRPGPLPTCRWSRSARSRYRTSRSPRPCP